jgi:hypothetical protein
MRAPSTFSIERDLLAAKYVVRIEHSWSRPNPPQCEAMRAC